jgi:aspartate/methionine/tyrosine aminotransferase
MTPETTALLCSGVLALALAIYIFTPSKDPLPFTRKSRLDFLEERRDALYENLRDLNFEYRAGKYPEEDYRGQREQMEAEAALLLNEIEHLRTAAR